MRGMRASAWLAMAALVTWTGPLASGAMRLPPDRQTTPRAGCRVFPADNVWNMDISNLPVHPSSATWKAAMHAGTTRLHPDFGPPAYGIPFNRVHNVHATVHVRFAYAGESDPGPYPFGPSTRVEAGSDRHALMINVDTCTLSELYAARWNDGSPTAGSGAVFHLGSNALRPATWTSADAAGLPIYPGLVRWSEVHAGFIGHAIRVTSDCTSRRYLWPARHQAGVADWRCPPMGARFRLKAGFVISHYGPGARTILLAMKRYGLIVADNGSDWFFQGTVDGHWTNALMDQLKSVPAGAFAAVDESACKVGPNSGAFAYGAGCPAPG